jgi:ABC-type lipoprotein release transport system permease subunit
MVGIDPARERGVSHLAGYTLSDGGSSFLDDPAGNSILISKEMAEKLALGPGDKLVVMIQNAAGGMVGAGMTVRGVFKTPVDAFDRYTVFTGIRRLQELAGIGDRVSEINIVLKDRNGAMKAKSLLRGAIASPEIDVLAWQEMAPNLVSSIMIVDTMMYVSFAIIFITIIFSIANTLVMAIMERFHEIGVMKSIGTRPSWIFSLVMIEASFLGAVGLLAGSAAGVALTSLMAFTGIDFSFYMESMRTWGTGSIIYPAIKPLDIAVASGIVLATTVLAALYPALKAARIRPLEALHYT